jgi:hypothetical protein
MKNIKKTIRTAALAFFISSMMSFSPPTTQSSFYGEFKIRKIMNYYDSHSSHTNYIATANLYANAVSSSQSWIASNQGQVYYNGSGLKYDPMINFYTDTLERKTNTGIKWSVTTAGSTTGFSTSLTDTFPDFDYIVCLPDVLDKSKNLKVDLNNCSYADEVEVTIWDGQFRTTVPFYRRTTIKGNSNIVIQKSDLSSLSGPGVIVTVSLIKNELQTINGKTYKFEKRFDLVRPMPLI